jgi:hypothetical protein
MRTSERHSPNVSVNANVSRRQEEETFAEKVLVGMKVHLGRAEK